MTGQEPGRDSVSVKPAAVVLLSGGLDSATVLAIASRDYECTTLSFDYAQRSLSEIKAAQKLAEKYGATHKLIHIDRGVMSGSALTDPSIAVPEDIPDDAEQGIPVTYVPARNTLFLSHALAVAEVISSRDIFIGVNALDYSGYPDCRPEYIRAFQQMANLATKAAVEKRQSIAIHAPLIDLSKSQIIQKGLALGVDYSLTHSCYDPLSDGKPCGHCDACQLRLKGFREAGLNDLLTYPDDIK